MRKKRILIVDDDPDLVELLNARLSAAGYEVSKSQDGKNIFEKINNFRPDLILLDIMLPDVDGLSVKNKLNEDTGTASIPVIFLTAKDSVSDKVKGLDLGADDYITKPFNPRELLSRIEAALKRREFYEEISMTDGLTGLYNINFFKKQLSLFFNIAKRYKKVFSLIIIDIDHLKRINDTCGHLGGDFILKKFSSILKETLRKSDIIARYGGDEFVIIMPETDNKRATVAVERLKSDIKDKVFILPNGKEEVTISISAGIATYADSFIDESQMFESADKRLYTDKAKEETNA